MKSNLLMLGIFLLLIGCHKKKSIHISEFNANDMDNGILIDVRTPEEFDAGHLPNASNVNWQGEDFIAYFDTVDKGKTIYLYCKKGGRSAKASETLHSLGFKTVDLIGGHDAFIAKEIVKEK